MLSVCRAGLQLLLLFMLLDAAPAVAQQDRADAPLIVDGTPAGPSDNPFQVGLVVKSITNNLTAQFCGGSLIAPDLVVTAAHCDYHSTAWRPDEVQVLTGTRNLSQGGVRRDVTTISQHPNYRPDGYDYDVAVWKLASRAEDIPLARLATSDGIVGSELLVTGWGRTSGDGQKSATLLKVSVPVASHQSCIEQYGDRITSRMLCAGFKVDGKGSCRGDSGGPATRGTGGMILTGIVSWGSGACDQYGVYTRVSDPAIRDFIRGYLN
jgi:secreted trypsin-like serine protease